MDETRTLALQGLLKQLGIKMDELNILDQALTHSSYVNEGKNRSKKHNERIEFLGDAILNLAISEYLFNYHPHLKEGELTKLRASIVCEETLAKKAMEMALGEFLLMGKGEEATGGRTRPSILADALEALLGAVFIECGYEKSKVFIQNLFEELLKEDQPRAHQDAKTVLQEMIQKNEVKQEITYEILQETGPDHRKQFIAGVRVGNRMAGRGEGSTKKEAEQQAAYNALKNLGLD